MALHVCLTNGSIYLYAQQGDAALRELEGNALAGVKGAAGLQPSLEALNEVMGHERDIVLTRSACSCDALLAGVPPDEPFHLAPRHV